MCLVFYHFFIAFNLPVSGLQAKNLKHRQLQRAQGASSSRTPRKSPKKSPSKSPQSKKTPTKMKQKQTWGISLSTTKWKQQTGFLAGWDNIFFNGDSGDGIVFWTRWSQLKRTINTLIWLPAVYLSLIKIQVERRVHTSNITTIPAVFTRVYSTE